MQQVNIHQEQYMENGDIYHSVVTRDADQLKIDIETCIYKNI